MRALRILGLVLAVLTSASGARADFPEKSKTIRIVVPYTPGGFNDTLARIVAQKFTDDWGVSAVVENRPGGGTLIGTDPGRCLPRPRVAADHGARRRPD